MLFRSIFALNAGMETKISKLPITYDVNLYARWNKTPLIIRDYLLIGGKYSVRGFDGKSNLGGEKGYYFVAANYFRSLGVSEDVIAYIDDIYERGSDSRQAFPRDPSSPDADRYLFPDDLTRLFKHIEDRKSVV